jgi:hypothetical protein
VVWPDHSPLSEQAGVDRVSPCAQQAQCGADSSGHSAGGKSLLTQKKEKDHGQCSGRARNYDCEESQRQEDGEDDERDRKDAGIPARETVGGNCDEQSRSRDA